MIITIRDRKIKDREWLVDQAQAVEKKKWNRADKAAPRYGINLRNAVGSIISHQLFNESAMFVYVLIVSFQHKKVHNLVIKFLDSPENIKKNKIDWVLSFIIPNFTFYNWTALKIADIFPFVPRCFFVITSY